MQFFAMTKKASLLTITNYSILITNYKEIATAAALHFDVNYLFRNFTKILITITILKL